MARFDVWFLSKLSISIRKGKSLDMNTSLIASTDEPNGYIYLPPPPGGYGASPTRCQNHKGE